MTSGNARPRLVEARWDQVELRAFDLDGLLAADHRARPVWSFVERLDLSKFYARNRSKGKQRGGGLARADGAAGRVVHLS